MVNATKSASRRTIRDEAPQFADDFLPERQAATPFFERLCAP
jgi:hypothetical protein